MKKGAKTMKTFTLFCIENLIEVIQEKRSIKMDISTLNLQTTENIQLDVKQVQHMRKAWEDELNLFFVHVNTYGFIYTNPFSNFKKFAIEAISFGMTYLLRQSPIAKKHWDYPIDLADIADQMIKEISAVECINFHEELEVDEEYVHRSEFLEFGDRSSFKRVYEAGDGIYTLFSKKGHTFNIKELPLYNPELASALMLKESEYHRLLILASIAHGHFNDYLESNDSYDFMNWSLEEFKERAKIETKFYGKGNLSFGGQVDQVKVDSFHHFNLIVDGQIFLHMTVESDNELRAFPHILLNRGEIKERQVFLEYVDQEGQKQVFADQTAYHYSFDKSGDKIFDVRYLPLYKSSMMEIVTMKGLSVEEYYQFLILASIAKGDLDEYMEEPFHHAIEFNEQLLNNGRMKVVVEFSGDGYWKKTHGGMIDGVFLDSYEKLSLLVDDELVIEFEINPDIKNDKDKIIKVFLDIMLNLNGDLIDHF
ncbi:hypothetical protein P8815_17985 [Bacillus altitudinis]|uniref:hypothetical protein n=1 Tax=Bacillus TaxID=1386 RepID=UPI000260AA1F|nr:MULTISPECIES: hypothetical protein [Bacillus]EIL82741.1 hypothetical protein BAME_40420 [Bacillus sp. M 2-6]MEC0473630.1 hypothetical protein [Bacillus altitudinis]